MKLTKKILSLVLAAALVLGSIAVAANAADYDGLTYEGSVLTYKVTADKTEVKPGETVTFSVYMTTNYYTGAAGGLFAIWNANVFDELGTNYTIENFGTTFTNTVVSPARTASYPSGYGTSDYIAFQSIHALTAGVTTPKILNNELVYTFTFTVLETAEPGTTATFEIPAGAVKSAALPGMKGMTYVTIGTSASDPTSTKGYAETTDVSDASVTITVASAVEYCDYSALETAVAKTPDLDEDYYDADAYAEWEAAVEAGQALLDADALEKSDENQATIDDAAQLIEDKLAALEPEYLDLTYLNKTVSDCDELDYEEEYYDVDDYAKWEAALAAAKQAQADYNETMPATYQSTVDEIADKLYDAHEALVPEFINLTDLSEAVEAYDELPYGEEYYDADLYAAWEDALAAAEQALTDYYLKPATLQSEVDAIEDALVDAYNALDAGFADVSVLADYVRAYGSTPYAEEYYDAEEYAAWEKALDDAKAAVEYYATQPATKQGEVNAIGDELQNAYNALEPGFASLDELLKAVEDCAEVDPAEKDYYDADAYEAWQDALAAAEEATTTYAGASFTKQTEIDEITKALTDAYEALEPSYVDLTKLNEYVNVYSETTLNEEYYDADLLAEWETALAAAVAAQTTYEAAPVTQQAEVDAIADDLQAAWDALTPNYVSYEKVEQALADYGTPEYAQIYYTADSWADYAEAKAAAQDLVDNVPELPPAATEENQAVVDAYATALEEAYKALEAEGCHVISVTPLQEVYDLNDTINLSVLVEGTATKIQLIRGTSSTSTYARNNSAVKSITDNGDGTETWIIARRIYEKDYTEYAKAKFGKVWDTGVTPYKLKCTGEDSEVKSVEMTLNGEVVTEAYRSDMCTFTVVTGPATKKIRFLDPVTGGSISFTTPAYVNDDGTKVWIYNKKYNCIKQYDLDVYVAGSNGKWTDSGFDLEINIVAEPVSNLPSTGLVADAVLSAEVAKTRILRNATQTFTITTDKDCKSVRILNADGSVFRTITAAESVADGVATWTCSCAYSSIGDRSYTVEALYGSEWLADDDGAVSFTVIY